MESLRILMNAPSVRMGEPIAQNIHQEEFVRNLRDMGHEVHLVTRSQKGYDGDIHRIFSGDVPLARVMFNMDDYFTMERLILDVKPDIVHDRGYIFGGIGSFLARKYKVPSVMQIDDDWVRSESMTSPIASTRPYVRLAEWWTRKIVNLPDLEFTVSETLKKMIWKRYGVPEGRIGVVPNGVDTDFFRPDLEPLGLREKYGIKGVMVLFIGALGPWHGIDNLVRAMSLLKKENITALIIGGSAEDIETYRQMSRSLGMEKKLVFTGFIPHEQVPRALVEADIAVAPYPNMEFGFSPFKILEYMAAGRAIIASELPSIRELLTDKEAVIVRSWEAQELANAITGLAKDEERRRELGRRAREKAVREFTWRRSTERLVEIYRRAL